MQQITLNISNSAKAEAFLSFIRQLDFIELVNETEESVSEKDRWEEEFLKIGVWNIDENEIKLKNWKLQEF